MPRQQPAAPPPSQPSQPGKVSPPVAERIGATAAAAAAGPAVAAGATLAQATQIAAAIVSNTAKFLVKRRSDDLLFLVMALMVARPELGRPEAEKLAKSQLGYEQKFRDGVIARLRRDLPKALQLENPSDRQARVQEILAREKRYLAMRQEAMLDRAIAEAEHRLVREASPRGAFWKLSPYVKEHTLDCIALGEKFWPWEVLDVVHPPTHHGCRCMLFTLGEAVDRGLMTEAQIPDTKEAVSRAKGIIKQFGLLKESLSEDDERQLIEQLVEEAEVEALRDRHQLGEAKQRRYPRGFSKGGEFRPQRGYDPGKAALDRARSLVGHLLPPALAKRRSKGRWHRMAGRTVFVPEQRRFERTFGSRTFTSPPGTSDVFVGDRPHLESPRSRRTGELAVPPLDPELVRLRTEWYQADARRGRAALAGAPDLPKLEQEADEAERRYHEARVKLGIGKPAPGLQVGDRVIDDQGFDGSVTKIDGDRISVKLESGGTFRYRPEQLRQPGKPSPETAFRVAAYAADRNTKREMPVAVGASGADTVDGLEQAGFVEIRSGEGRDRLWMEFSHESGARLRVSFASDTGRVEHADWTPGRAVRGHDQALRRPPVSYREFAQSLDDYVRRTASEHGTVPHLAGIHVDTTGEIADDHSGSHEWTGEVLLGREVLDDIERMAIERDHGQPVTDPGDVWASYRVGYHESGHAVNPISQAEYSGYEGMGLEEALTEEAGSSEAMRALREQGQDDVLDWLASNPTDHRSMGTYPGFRKRMDDLLNEAKIDPADREQVIRDLKFDTRPERRYDRLADMLVAGGAFTDHEKARKHARTRIGSGEHDLAGFVPIVPSPAGGRPVEFPVRGGSIRAGSRVLIRRRVVDRKATAGGPPKFKTELKPATILDIGNKLNDPTIPFTASVAYDSGGGEMAIVPDQIARILDDSPELRIDGRPLKPGDGIRYDNQRDGGYRQATVRRILRVGDHWAVEVESPEGASFVLTPGRAGQPLERAAPDVLQPDPAQTARPGLETPDRPTQALPDPGQAIPSAVEMRAHGAARAQARLNRAVADVEEQFAARKAHIERSIHMGFQATAYDIGHAQGLELGRRALLNGATPDELLKVALTYGPRRGGSDQNEGVQAGLRGAALALRDQAYDVEQYRSPATKLSPDSGDSKLFHGDAADDPLGFNEWLESMGAPIPPDPVPEAEPDVLHPVDPQKLFGGEILEHPDSKERFRVVNAIGNKKKLRKAELESLTTKKRQTLRAGKLAKFLFVSGGGWQPKQYTPKEPPAPKTTDDGQLTFTKPAGGMGGAMFADDPAGDPWVVKGYRGNQDRVANELVANRVYRALGIPVPEAGLCDVQGKPALAYRRVDGMPGGKGLRVQKPSKDIGKGFMADALLGNWDVVGLDHDNLLWPTGKIEGEPVRLDQGGTFQFRALGQKKPFGPVPSEVWSMRGPKGQAFGTMDVSDEDARAQAAHIAATLTPETVGELFADAPFLDPHMRAENEAALNARVEWMRRYADGEVDVPQPLRGGDAIEMFRESQSGMKPKPEETLAIEKFPKYEAEVQQALRTPSERTEPLTPLTADEAEQVKEWGELAAEAAGEGEIEGREVLVTRRGGKPEAIVAFAPGGKGFLRLSRLATRQQGKGAGTAALKAAAGLAAERGLGLEVAPSLKAQGFYAEAGMQKEGGRFFWTADEVAKFKPRAKHISFMVGELDAVLRRAKTREDSIAYLPIPAEAAAEADPKKLMGSTLSERGFLVMTSDERKARRQAKGGVIFRVLIPAGSNVISPRQIADQDYPAQAPDVIGPRNSRIRVIRWTDTKGIPHLDAVLVG